MPTSREDVLKRHASLARCAPSSSERGCATHVQMAWLIEGLCQMPQCEPFMHPVDWEHEPDLQDYGRIVTQPMDMTQIRPFRLSAPPHVLYEQLCLMFRNCMLYNPESHTYHRYAVALLRHTQLWYRCFQAGEPPHADLVRQKFAPAMSLLRALEESAPFAAPVDLELYTDYAFEVIWPMDLDTLDLNLKQCLYHADQEFLQDLGQIFANCRAYNPRGTLVRDMGETVFAFVEPLLETGDVRAMFLPNEHMKLRFYEDMQRISNAQRLAIGLQWQKLAADSASVNEDDHLEFDVDRVKLSAFLQLRVELNRFCHGNSP